MVLIKLNHGILLDDRSMVEGREVVDAFHSYSKNKASVDADWFSIYPENYVRLGVS